MKKPIINDDPTIRTDIDLLINLDESGEVWETRGAKIHVNDDFIKTIIPYFTVTEEQLINLVSKMLTILYLKGYVDDDEKKFILGDISADQLLDLMKQKEKEDTDNV